MNTPKFVCDAPRESGWYCIKDRGDGHQLGPARFVCIEMRNTSVKYEGIDKTFNESRPFEVGSLEEFSFHGLCAGPIDIEMPSGWDAKDLHELSR